MLEAFLLGVVALFVGWVIAQAILVGGRWGLRIFLLILAPSVGGFGGLTLALFWPIWANENLSLAASDAVFWGIVLGGILIGLLIGVIVVRNDIKNPPEHPVIQ